MWLDTTEWVRILLRLLWYTGAGLLVSSIAAIAVRFWLPESMRMALFVTTYILCGGVVVVLLIRSLGKVINGSTGHSTKVANIVIRQDRISVTPPQKLPRLQLHRRLSLQPDYVHSFPPVPISGPTELRSFRLPLPDKVWTVPVRGGWK